MKVKMRVENKMRQLIQPRPRNILELQDMNYKILALIGLILMGVVFSGCTRGAQESQSNGGEKATPQPPQAELTESDISEIESDLSDLDSLIADIEEIDSLDISDLDPEDL